MESDKPKRNRNNYFQGQRKIMSLISSLRNRNNAISEQEHRTNEHNEATEIINKNAKPHSVEKWTATGTVALAIITGFLAWYTYKLFDEASHASKYAAQTHTNDSILANRRFISDSILAYKRFQNETATINKQIALADKGLQQQIQSLNETKKRF